jgi:hypothetical protein
VSKSWHVQIDHTQIASLEEDYYQGKKGQGAGEVERSQN